MLVPPTKSMNKLLHIHQNTSGTDPELNKEAAAYKTCESQKSRTVT